MELRPKITLFLLLLLPFTSFSQLSQGGTPLSFSLKQAIRTETHTMPAIDASVLVAEDEINNVKKDRPYRFGKNFPVSIDNLHHGTWTELDNGDRLWMLSIESKGAFSINLTFDQFNLPEGSRLFIYNEAKDHVIGAFTNENNQEDGRFATDLVKGDKIYLEYLEPRYQKGKGIISIEVVTHAYRDMFAIMKNFGSSGSCNMNVNCPQAAAWQDQKRSVVMLVSGGNGFCTGSVINNTLNDGTPYILTANHCGNSGFSTWVFRFNWEASGCTNPSTSPSYVSLTGSLSRASNAASDFRLLELSNQIPASYNAYFNGWDNSGSVPTSSVSIHHPSGDIKKISFDQDPSTAMNWGGSDVWRILNWEFSTTTEPGSSGSPLFDQNGRTIGQLYGGSAACGNTLEDYYGRLSSSWNGSSSSNRLKDWLDPNNSGAVTLNGFDPNAPTLALDAGLTNFLSPAAGGTGCDDSLYPVVQLKNFGSDTLVSATIFFRINNGSWASQTWTGMLITGSNTSITLPAMPLSNGMNTYSAYVSNPNNGTDLNNNNDTATTTYNKISPTGISLPVSQGFETTFPSGGWTINNPDGSDTWMKDAQRGAYGQSNSSIYVENYSYNAEGARDDLISPFITLNPSSGQAYLTFDRAYARYSAGSYDSLIVYISSDCGSTWTRLFAKGNMDLVTNGQTNTSSNFLPASSHWVTDSINLNGFVGPEPVQFKFQNYNGYGNNLYLDNINISTPTGVKQFEEEAFAIYPNPASDRIFLEMKSQGELVIYNSMGQECLRKNLNAGSNVVQVELLANGLYTFTVTTDKRQSAGKIVIN